MREHPAPKTPSTTAKTEKEKKQKEPAPEPTIPPVTPGAGPASGTTPPEKMPTLSSTTVKLVKGDITQQKGSGISAIINAANPSLLGGGGIDGAIHKAAGYETTPVKHDSATCALCKECKKIKPDTQGERCPTRQARITGSAYLKKKEDIDFIIHTVGPQGSTPDRKKLLKSAYTHCLELARQHDVTFLAFPSISTGIYGYPIAEAAGIALKTVFDFIKKYPDAFTEVRFVLF
jgi:O-acetyl-ADP-ribose deacetylase (regulator of RNase III)